MNIELIFENAHEDASLEGFLDRVAGVCFELEGVDDAFMTVVITDDQGIRTLNRDMRDVDRVTDVLSFPTVSYPAGKTAGQCPKRVRREYDPALGKCNLGDCVIDLEQARRQAEEFGHSLMRELGYLTAHSAFHLMGYDHMEDGDKRVMREMEKRAMRVLSLWRGDGSMDYDVLFKRACEALDNSYAPYSHFKVGACILTEDGSMFSGCNFENASLGATICAERCAASCAIAAGKRRFAAIAIAGESAPAWPCGICRQVLREFSPLSMPVIVGQKGGEYRVLTLEELLPRSFGPEDLQGKGE
ncbi:MAG: cytidine deaminase [Clostridiales bacterium]|nr:cytidine deaminase [Clostridiales bacterium]